MYLLPQARLEAAPQQGRAPARGAETAGGGQ